MRQVKKVILALVMTAIAATAPAATSASAGNGSRTWGLDFPTLGPTLAALAVGEKCADALEPREIEVITKHLERVIGVMVMKVREQKLDVGAIAKDLRLIYADAYDNPERCDSDARVWARKMLTTIAGAEKDDTFWQSLRK